MASSRKIVNVKNVAKRFKNVMNRLYAHYCTTARPQLLASLGMSNLSTAPRLEKVVLNMGLGKSIQDPTYTDAAIEVLRRITGQQPVKTLAKKSISNFKIRKDMVVGVKVTLRGERMYAFIDRMINIALPRVRDFRGLPRDAFDGKGNYSIGFTEHIVFPEISSDEVEKIIGFEVNIVTTAQNNAEGMALLTILGFPFMK